jgi:hypothetical protein
MEFLQPSWLWGILAVSVPVAIHFWNQRKGKTLQWAASRWLSDKTTLNHRGIRLHEIPLMLIRCLLLILLALVLGEPVLDWLSNSGGTQTVHIVHPDRKLVDNFRFELESALKNGEQVYWVVPQKMPVEKLSEIPAGSAGELYLQQTINQIVGPKSNFKIYLHADQYLAELPKTWVPGPFQIYSLADSSSGKGKGFEFDRNRPVNVLLTFRHSVERETAEAGLMTLADVYKIPFKIDVVASRGKVYDLVMTDHLPKTLHTQTLYVVSGQPQRFNTASQVLQIPDSLKLSSSAVVENGRLPELLGQAILKHRNGSPDMAPLSNQQLHALFVQAPPAHDLNARQVRKWLLLLLVLTTLLERWMSLRKNRNVTYA